MHAITRNKLLLATFLMTLLYAFHYGIPLYVTSTYLHTFFNGSYVSGLYVAASFMTLLASLHLAKYITYFHTYTFTLGLLVSEIIITAALGITTNPWLVGLFFIAHFVTQALLLICINVFVETFSKHAETGSTRGIFLMLYNLGILVSPIIGGIILTQASFSVIYIIAAVMLLPCIFFLHQYMHHLPEPAYKRIDMFGAFRRAWANTDLRGALTATFMLESFYAVMVIYSPIYLEHIGIPLTTYLSIILPFALLPLVLLPYELGWLADMKYGEKEIMIIGMIILMLSLFFMVITTTPSVIMWIALLIFSRIGAACVETMAFAYYYKKIQAEDVSLTALFGNVRTIATIAVGSLGIGIAPLLIVYPQLMFIIMGCLIALSLTLIFPMRDTR